VTIKGWKFRGLGKKGKRGDVLVRKGKKSFHLVDVRGAC
jgi:hypothetical protein